MALNLSSNILVARQSKGKTGSSVQSTFLGKRCGVSIAVELSLIIGTRVGRQKMSALRTRKTGWININFNVVFRDFHPPVAFFSCRFSPRS